jgi:endoglucanase
MTRRVSVVAAVMTVLAVVIALRPYGATESPVPAVRVDQAGYLVGARKLAMSVGTGGASATVLLQPSRREVLAVPLGAAVTDPQSGDTLRAIDFSVLTAPGTYTIEVKGVGESVPFSVASNVYSDPLYLATRAFYGQRCGTAVDLGPRFKGYVHAACHMDDAQFHASSGRTGSKRATGGWHDAGDYGKYIVNSGITTGELLWAWEWYPKVFETLSLDIPESGNRVPYLLDEIRWNLDWMLTMQDEDGGVWPKLTSERFGSFVMPEKDDGGPRFIIGTGSEPYKSSCATADFAAVFAIAARVYRPYDTPYADRALAAARKAQTWVTAHPDVLFRNPPGVATGEYGDRRCTDERLWAAAELFRTTGEPPFGDLASQLAGGFHVAGMDPQSWPNVANLGLWAYAWSKGAPEPLRTRVATETAAAAREIAQRASSSPWRHSLTDRDLVWGSNAVVANYGILLLAANRFASDPSAIEAALDNLHYLLGRNTFGLSWVTAIGARPYRHPHHRPSGGDQNEEPWPGMLSGGPNARGGDPVLAGIPATPPARRYADDERAYSANEIAINWQAALVLLLAGVQGS